MPGTHVSTISEIILKISLSPGDPQGTVLALSGAARAAFVFPDDPPPTLLQVTAPHSHADVRRILTTPSERAARVELTLLIEGTERRCVVQVSPSFVGDRPALTLEVSCPQQGLDTGRRFPSATLARIPAMASIGTWDLDLVTGNLTWSAETYHLFGIPDHTPIDQDLFYSCVHPDDRALVEDAFESAQRTGQFSIEHRILVEGEVCWVHEMCQFQHDRRGNPLKAIGTVQDITPVKEVELELIESKRQLHNLLTNLPGIAFRRRPDAEFSMTFLSDGFEHLIGYPPAEFTSGAKSFADLILPEDRAVATQSIHSALWIQDFYQVDYRAKTASGRVKWLWEQARRVTVDGEEFLEGLIIDITNMKEMEEKLTNSEALSRGIVSSLLDPMWMLDRDMNITWANIRMLDQYGVELMGKKCHEVLRGTDDPCHACFIKEVFQLNMPAEREMQFSKPFEEERTFWCTASPSVHGPDGTPTHVVEIIRDITEQRKSEQRANLLVEALEQSPVAMIITDIDARVQYANPAHRAISGFETHEILGQVPSILQQEGPLAEENREVWETIAQGKVWRGDRHSIDKNGTSYDEEVVVAPIRGESGSISNYVVLKKDVTLEKTLENQLQQMQKMDAVGQLASGVAHDFNNILGIITGHTELVLSVLPEDSEPYEDLKEVTAACEKAASLVKQLNLFSRTTESAFSHLDAPNIVERTLRMLQRVLGENIELRFNQKCEDCFINGDATQIEQVIINLCLNARDAMAEGGGTLLIETESVYLDRDFCQFHPMANEGHFLKLSVSDTGHGIPAAVKPRIFEPFFTTKGSQRGTGLGLSTVYAIVRKHSGFIDVISDIGQGTSFWVYIPLELPTEQPQRSQTGAQVAATLGAGQTILLAEDDPQLRKLANRILKKGGYNVLVAADGQEAIDLYNEQPHTIAAALLDVVMPKKSGRDVFEHIRRHDEELPVLFMSGYSFQLLEQGQLPESIDEEIKLLRKPYTRKDLLQFLRRGMVPKS